MAKYPDPRRIIPNPALHAYILRLGLPLHRVGTVAGITHQSRLSVLLLSPSLADTPLNREQLLRVATVVKFPGPAFFDDTNVATEAVTR